jgi:biopolymer transport protein ExbD
MRERKNGRRRRRSGGLLLTPLIDIIFLLALFFVLNTSFRQERYIDVELPESDTSEDIQAVGLVLTLRNDGTLALDGREVAWESLTNAIEERAGETGASEVTIRGDERVEYGTVVSAMDRIRKAGIEAVSMQTVRSVDGSR